MTVKCKVCKKEPKEILSVVMYAKEEGMSPEEFIQECDGTYNSRTKEFYCNNCYIKVGMPLGTA